jgi:hypothetical protein
MEFNKVDNHAVWLTKLNCEDLSDEIKLEKVISTTNRTNKHALSVTQPNIILINEYLKSPEFKQSVIDIILQYELIERYYPKRFLNNISKYTTIGHLFHKQGYDNHHLHLDYRTSIAQGLIYFDKQNNALHSTRVHVNNNKIITADTTSGNGILILNTENNWHTGGNLSNEDRYFALYSLELVLKE